jgi:hypothetical protein
MIADTGVESVKLPPRSPNLNAVWSGNSIRMNPQGFHQCLVLAIMGFENPASSRPISLSANRRFRMNQRQVATRVAQQRAAPLQ